MNNPLSKRIYIFDSSKLDSEYINYFVNYGKSFSQNNFNKYFTNLYGIFALLLIFIILYALFHLIFNPDKASIYSQIQFHLKNSIVNFLIFFLFINTIYFINKLFQILTVNSLEINNNGIILIFKYYHSPLLSFDNLSYVKLTSSKLFPQHKNIKFHFTINTQQFKLKDKLWIIFSLPLFNLVKLNNGLFLNINLKYLDSSEDLYKLSTAISKYIPSYLIDPNLIDQLSLNSHLDTYTDIWLNSISLSNSYSPKNLVTNDKIGNGNYLIKDIIAIGGQSKVYLGEDINNQKIIIKEFIIPSNTTKNVQKRILQHIITEASLIKQLNHPKIVKFKDLFVEENRAYLISNYIEGITLNKYPQEKVNEALLIKIMRQLLEILEYIHSQNPPIIHRDFTNDNLIINEDNEITLIDFNVACQLESKFANTIPGKTIFMPPEQFQGNPCPQSDLYAFGICLYILITGSEPEPLTQVKATLNNNEAIANIIFNATALNIEQRSVSASQILKDNLFLN